MIYNNLIGKDRLNFWACSPHSKLICGSLICTTTCPVSNDKRTHSKGLKKLPFPQYFVFFNGLEEEPDRRILKFSDAFIGMGQITDQDGVPLIPALEIQAVMININLGRNEALMRACPVLREYAQFVAKTRENIGRHLSAEEAVKKAVNDCINEGILRDLLISWKAEDINMIIEEFTEEEMWELNRKEIEEEATAKGMAKGMEKGMARGTVYRPSSGTGSAEEVIEIAERASQNNIGVLVVPDHLSKQVTYNGILLSYGEFYYTVVHCPYLFAKGVICIFDGDTSTSIMLYKTLAKLNVYGYRKIIYCNENTIVSSSGRTVNECIDGYNIPIHKF